MARLTMFTPGRGKGMLEITAESISGVEAYIRWAEIEVPSQIPFAMDNLVHQMALMNQSIARKMAAGPYDPQERDHSLAWRTPAQGIRRISNAYFIGWKVYKVGMAHYRLENRSREAYFIEFGISAVGFGGVRHVPYRRIRRPVRKLSQLKTMDFMRSTQAWHRVWTDMYRARHTRGGFTQIVQSPAGGHTIFAPWGMIPNEGGGSFTGPKLGSFLP